MKPSAPPPIPDRGPWQYEVESLGGHRWRVYLTRGALIYGPEAYGWVRWGLDRARRKGQRELHRMVHREADVAAKQARADRLRLVVPEVRLPQPPRGGSGISRSRVEQAQDDLRALAELAKREGRPFTPSEQSQVDALAAIVARPEPRR